MPSGWGCRLAAECVPFVSHSCPFVRFAGKNFFMPFIHDDFLLSTAQAKSLYHGYAAGQPIIDYHCHLEPKDLATNRRFANPTEIWLDGDHYIWRAMRAMGIDQS